MKKQTTFLLFVTTSILTSAAFCAIIHGKINVSFNEMDWLRFSKPFTQQKSEYELNGFIRVDTEASGAGLAKLPQFVDGMTVNGRLEKVKDGPEGCSYYSICLHTEEFASIVRNVGKLERDILFYPAHSLKPQSTLTAVYCPPHISPMEPYDIVIQTKNFSEGKEAFIEPIVARHIQGYLMA